MRQTYTHTRTHTHTHMCACVVMIMKHLRTQYSSWDLYFILLFNKWNCFWNHMTWWCIRWAQRSTTRILDLSHFNIKVFHFQNNKQAREVSHNCVTIQSSHSIYTNTSRSYFYFSFSPFLNTIYSYIMYPFSTLHPTGTTYLPFQHAS